MENKCASSLRCPECGGEFAASDLLDGDSIATCLNCNKHFLTSEILHKSTDERIEEIRSKAYADVEKDRTQAYRDVEEGKRKIEYERMKREFDREDKRNQEADVKAFKKSKFRVVLIISIIISIILLAVAFNDGKIWAGIVAVVMTTLFVVSFLMGNNVIKEKRKNLRLIPAIIAFVLFIPCTALYTGSALPSTSDIGASEFQWSDFALGDKLPTPVSALGKVHTDSENSLSITVNNITKADYVAYKEQCINAGFSVDADSSNNSYSAYNNEGYEVKLRFYESDCELSIALDIPIQMASYSWPTTGIGSKLPSLISDKGKVSTNSSDTFTIYVGNVTIDDFNTYVNSCLAAGYDVDYSKYEKSFYAENSDGNSLTVIYEGFNTIYIHVHNYSD